MKLVHAADIHLGRRRLDGRLPDQDFADAFEEIARQAIELKAGVFLIAGDLFDRPQVEPSHLRQAQRVLSLLKTAGIPVVAIEGNHDKASIGSESETWLSYLSHDGLLHLLQTRFDSNGPLLSRWDDSARKGAWIELGGVRFIGAGYLGAATPHKVRQIVDAIESHPANVLLLHAGPDYFVGEGGGFSREDLKLIHAKVRYLALGHIHMPMLHGGWACNPGSPENCELRAALYDRNPKGEPVSRGYAVVEFDPANSEASVSVEIRSTTRRPCFHLALDCTPFGNKLKAGAEAIADAAVKAVREAQVPTQGAVELRLTGRINLNRVALDLDQLARQVETLAGVTAVSVNPSGINLGGETRGAGDSDALLSREEIERSAIRELVDAENLWGLDGEQAAFAGLFYDLKEAVRQDASLAELAEKVTTSPLVERIRVVQAGAPPKEPAASEGAER